MPAATSLFRAVRGASRRKSRIRDAAASAGRLAAAAAVMTLMFSCAGTGWQEEQNPRGWDEQRQRADLRMQALIENGEYRSALELADSLEAAGLGDTRLAGQKAMAVGMLGRPDEAIELFEKALLKDYEDCENHLNFAVLLMKLGKTGRADTEFREALRFCDPANLSMIFRNLAVADIKSGKQDDALIKVQEGLVYDPGDSYLLGLKGMLVAESDPVLAESLLTDLEEAGEMNPEFLYQLGLLFLKTGRPGLAIMPFESVYRRMPGDRETGINFSEALSRAGRWEEAAGVLEEMNRRQPDEEVARRLAAIYYKQDRFRDALSIYATLPENPGIMDRKAMCLHNLGRSEEALRLQRKVVEARPDWTVALVNLSAILGALGELEEAEEVLRRVLLIDPDNAAATINLERIRKAREEAGR